MSFFISSFFILILIFLAKKFHFGLDIETGKQKFHTNPTPRTGGIAIVISVLFSYWYYEPISLTLILISLIPITFISLYEDLVNTVKPITRLVLIFLSSFILVITTDISINSLDFYYLDAFLEVEVFNIIFTVLTISLMVNSFNMVDGFNGLIGGLVILYLFSIMIVAQSFDDSITYDLSLYLFYAVIGFLVFNFPNGKIFLGDLGAYFLGFLISLILINFVNSNDISHWFSMTLMIYPIYEVVFSIIRKRLFSKKRAMEPDEYHLHMLVYKNLVKCKWFSNSAHCNSFTSVIIWLFNVFPIYAAISFHDDFAMLISSSLIFMTVYTICYVLIFSLEKRKK